jgi:hypothetical protein
MGSLLSLTFSIKHVSEQLFVMLFCEKDIVFYGNIPSHEYFTIKRCFLYFLWLLAFSAALSTETERYFAGKNVANSNMLAKVEYVSLSISLLAIYETWNIYVFGIAENYLFESLHDTCKLFFSIMITGVFWTFVPFRIYVVFNQLKSIRSHRQQYFYLLHLQNFK